MEQFRSSRTLPTTAGARGAGRVHRHTHRGMRNEEGLVQNTTGERERKSGVAGEGGMTEASTEMHTRLRTTVWGLGRGVEGGA